jgi:hypothetical protein
MTGGDASIFDSKLRRWQASDTDKLKQDYHKNYDELQVSIGRRRSIGGWRGFLCQKLHIPLII